MTQGEGFKHITMTAPEDEDEVVFAGVPAGLEPEPEPEPAAEPVPEPEPAAKPAALAAREPAAMAEQPKPARQASGKESGGYRETTLEDLEREPMPFAQRVVIAAAVVCIIGAIIYYVAFMG